MVKFLLDENVPPAIGTYLRDKGFDAVHAYEVGMSGNTDDQIMNFAGREGRTLITFDKHFSDLLLYPLSTHWGVIRIRIHPPLLADVLEAIQLLLSHFDMSTIQGALIVLEKDGCRVRRAALI